MSKIKEALMVVEELEVIAIDRVIDEVRHVVLLRETVGDSRTVATGRVADLFDFSKFDELEKSILAEMKWAAQWTGLLILVSVQSPLGGERSSIFGRDGRFRESWRSR